MKFEGKKGGDIYITFILSEMQNYYFFFKKILKIINSLPYVMTQPSF
jgi:hypothetical protein